MVELPKSCLVNKFLPKTFFNKKLEMSSALKDDMTNLIEKITWKYKLAEDTINISKVDGTVEIEIFEVQLKTDKIPDKIFKAISNEIPHKILFEIVYENKTCYGIIANDMMYYTTWDEDMDFEFKGFNLNEVYENIVKKIIREERNDNEFEDILEVKKRRDELIKQIEKLCEQIRKEKQFNKKVELNKKLHELKEELEEIQDVKIWF